MTLKGGLLQMAANIMSEGFRDLVEELNQLEEFFPLLGEIEDRDDLADEVRELEQILAVAQEPRDQHSMQALAYLQTQLARKRALLDGF
ncbi:MAG: hypothetical protein ACI9BW_002805 [Gammaproteobacteria bacterium]|jgi:hypothetical protein